MLRTRTRGFGCARGKRGPGGIYQPMPQLIEESGIALWSSFRRRRARLCDRRRLGGEAADGLRGTDTTSLSGGSGTSQGADEGQGGRKAAQREFRGAVACSQAVRGVSERRQEHMALQRARSLGARFEEEPHVNPNTGTMELSLRDPDGYYVTISALSVA